MASLSPQDLKLSLLLERVTRFLSNHSKSKAPLRQTLCRIKENEWRAVIFGGVLRDLLAFGNSEVPRDVDIVVSGVTNTELNRAFADLIYERTRFGGLRLRAKGWLIDIWALPDTWGFREGLMGDVSFDGLVQTVFLNVEAVAAEITARPGHSRKIYSAGFFEAMERQVLDIKLEPNPFPALCVVRTLTTALRLNHALSRRLAEYVVNYASKIPLEQLTEVQESHYGKVRIGPTRMVEYLGYIEDQLRKTSGGVVRLPTTTAKQLELSEYWTPAC